jgi:hypothetical protein
MTCFLISTSLCKSHMSISCFWSFQDSKKKNKGKNFLKKKRSKSSFCIYIFFINLLHKAKRKWNFLISLHNKYYKEGATVITQFLTILF